MKLASYLVDGQAAFGVVREDGVITMGERRGIPAASLKQALAEGLLAQIAAAADKARPDHKLTDITFLPVDQIACQFHRLRPLSDACPRIDSRE